MAISRILPKSSSSRFNALMAAKQKKDSTAAGAMAITPATTSRLDAITTAFNTARNTLSVKRAESILSTSQKETLLTDTAIKSSHYVQVLNMHIAQKLFPAAYRAYFKIDTNSSSVPSLKLEAEVVALAQAIVDGEPNMITAGGTAIPFPKLSVIQAALTALVAKQKDQSTKKDATDQAEEALAALNTEADAVVKKVWDEVETYFNEEPIEGLRRKSREWGVVYISDEKPATLTATVVDKATNTPVDAATISIVSSDEATTTDTTGAFTLKTGTEGAQVLSIEKAGYTTKEIAVTIVLGQAIDLGVVELEKVV
jgi:hypothetical protein